MGELTLPALALGALVIYMVSCAIWPYAACWWCGGQRNRGDGLGHFRRRGRCRVCGGGPYRRVGARLLGVG